MTTPLDLTPQFAIIVAGGSGNRMGTSVPKQFLPVGGVPILMHTLTRFFEYSPAVQLILVLPQKDQSVWEKLCERHHFQLPLKIVAGGATRFQSVKQGLAAIEAAEGLVAIHDGVRPFVPVHTIRESFEVAYQGNGAVAAVALKDSIRLVTPDGTNQSMDRTQFRLIQTPQTFRLPVIRKSFEQPEQSSFTDDASVVESDGNPVTLIEGSYQNIKITTPEDLVWAEAYLKLMS